MPIDELETPALCVDLDKLENNLARMGQYVQQHGLKLRPRFGVFVTPVIGKAKIAPGIA